MFENAEHFARFLGVSRVTAQRWRANPASVSPVGVRLLEVMEILRQHSPEMHAALVEQARPVNSSPRKRPPAPHIEWVTIPCEPPTWDDDYWFPRTVADLDTYPDIERDNNKLVTMTEPQLEAYWAACRSYEARTGRIYPD